MSCVTQTRFYTLPLNTEKSRVVRECKSAMRFNSDDIWYDVPVVKLTESVILPPGFFRFSLSDFL